MNYYYYYYYYYINCGRLSDVRRWEPRPKQCTRTSLQIHNLCTSNVNKNSWSVFEDNVPCRYKSDKAENVYIQGVPGGKDLTSGECSLGQTIPI